MNLAAGAKRAKDVVLNLLFPPRCPWCDRVLAAHGGEDCPCLAERGALLLPGEALPVAAPGPLQGAYACFPYRSHVRDAIWRLKFSDEAHVGKALGRFMAQAFVAWDVEKDFDLVVPVPVSPKTRRSRGFNQSALLARPVAEALGIPFAEDVLVKQTETKRQMDLSREERLENVKGAYRAPKPEAVRGKRVLLVDDVLTTGSTLNECARTLLQAGAAGCTGFCLAASLRDDDVEL